MADDHPLSFATRADGVEVGILGSDLVVRRKGMLTQWLYGRGDSIPLALASVHYTHGVLRIYRAGELWMILEGVEDHYVAIDLAEEVRRFNDRVR